MRTSGQISQREYDDKRRCILADLSLVGAGRDVLTDAVDDLLTANSMGKHYASTIKSSSNGGRYDCRP